MFRLFRLYRSILLCLMTFSLSLEWGPLGEERLRWGMASGDPFVREVALTFDDGPRERGMQELIEALYPFDLTASFFLVGKFAERYATITLSLHEAGHELENHTFTHPKLYTLWTEKIMREMERCNEVFENLNLPPAYFMRPPGGSFNLKVFNAVRRMDMRLGLWDVNTADYTGRASEDIIRTIMSTVGNGSVILMHSGVPNTVRALPELVRQLKARGYRIVSMRDLWNAGAI
ncbi:MAG: polysaccharide deacetylase family protein [Fretibacterium sp.]|nr:polysaccharide deacetylase family protein [Fretibacterium sp.]